MRKLVKKLLLELKIDILDYYPYEEHSDNSYSFIDKRNYRNILQYNNLANNGILIKFGTEYRGYKKINPGIQTRLKDEKVFNTYLSILFNELLPKYNYILYEPMNEDRSYDMRRAKLYKIGIEKYLNHDKWELKQKGSEWIIEKKNIL